jgi:ubiquitin-protein ligase
MAPSRRTSHGPSSGQPPQPATALQLPPEDTPLHELYVLSVCMPVSADALTYMHRRRRQIQSLFDNHFSAKERSPGSIYQVTVSLPTRSFGQPLVVSVLLPAQFPTEPPSLTVSPPIVHPWVSSEDGSRVVKHPGLLQGRWNQHVSLGRFVQEFADALVAQPPSLLAVPSSVAASGVSGQNVPQIPIDPSLQGKSYDILTVFSPFRHPLFMYVSHRKTALRSWNSFSKTLKHLQTFLKTWNKSKQRGKWSGT